MRLKSPEQLTIALNSLILAPAKKTDLNKRLANRSRQYFRAQIKSQRDIDGNSYPARKRRKITLDSKTQKAKNNKNMLMGFGRSLKTQISEDSFEVGLSGPTANMAKDHNDGRGVSFTTHVKGFYNSKTSQWEGGTKVQRSYKMTKRTFIGWTPALERELLAMVADNFLNNKVEK